MVYIIVIINSLGAIDVDIANRPGDIYNAVYIPVYTDETQNENDPLPMKTDVNRQLFCVFTEIVSRNINVHNTDYSIS